MQKLAYIGKIIKITPIKGADFIVSAEVICGKGGKWMGTVQKDQFKEGDIVEVYLQDAIVPEEPRFEFMEKHHWRVTMRKFKKVPSECLIMPESIVDNNLPVLPERKLKQISIGDDISEIMNVKKYIKQLPANLSGLAVGSFPTNLLPKTDEPNFQTVSNMIEALQGQRYYSTVKCDGSSGTIYRKDDWFGCCSRNLEFKESSSTIVWKIANDYNLKEILPNNMGIQFEMCGPGIQKNRLALDKVEPRLFNAYDLENRKYFGAGDLFSIAKDIGFPTVEIIKWNEIFDITDNNILRKMAEGKYKSGHQREGIVIRPMEEQIVDGERLSFKVINLLYKDS